MAKIKLIAHRGLVNGPNKLLENNPDTIMSALAQGFDCEVDLWVIDDELYLGHDAPQYKITEQFLKQSGLWIHCKHLPALAYCQDDVKLNYFWHENDSYTLTSRGYIWAFPEKALTKWSVMLMPEWHDPAFEKIKDANCFAICSDYVVRLKDLIPSDQS